MKVDFTAREVDCSEAIDWEIVQVAFDSASSGELDVMESDRESPCLTIGENFELPGAPQAQWHDGDDWGGSAGIPKVELHRTKALVDVGANRIFSISFELSNERYNELKEYLRILFQRSPGALVIEDDGDAKNQRMQ